MKYVFLTFKNARFYPKNKKENKPEFNELISTEQFSVNTIKNVLRVLFGERPINQFGKNKITKQFRKDEIEYFTDPEIEVIVTEIAKNSKVKITTLFQDEIIHTLRKDITNPKNIIPNWELIENYFSNDSEMFDILKMLFEKFNYHITDDFMSDIKCLTGNSQDQQVSDFCNTCCDCGYTEFSNLIKNYSNKGYKPQDSKYGHSFHKKKNTKAEVIVNSGVEVCKNISGKILLQMQDDELKLLERGNGFATIFDGGFVKIDSITDVINKLEYESYKNVIGNN